MGIFKKDPAPDIIVLGGEDEGKDHENTLQEIVMAEAIAAVHEELVACTDVDELIDLSKELRELVNTADDCCLELPPAVRYIPPKTGEVEKLRALKEQIFKKIDDLNGMSDNLLTVRELMDMLKTAGLDGDFAEHISKK